ncbi:hypothetical protein LZB68_09500, partial [Campylobacter lari]|nr:hypothetical protein [Campylobacter lari]
MRTIALGSTDGLKRNLVATNTDRPDLRAGRRWHPGPHHGRAGPPDRRSRPGGRQRQLGNPPCGPVVRRPVPGHRAA